MSGLDCWLEARAPGPTPARWGGPSSRREHNALPEGHCAAWRGPRASVAPTGIRSPGAAGHAGPRTPPPPCHARPHPGPATSGDSRAHTLQTALRKRAARGRAEPGWRRLQQGVKLPSGWGRGPPSPHETKAAFWSKRCRPAFPVLSCGQRRPHARVPGGSAAPRRPASLTLTSPPGPPGQPRCSSKAAAAAAEAPERGRRGRAAPPAGTRRPAAPLRPSRSRALGRAGPFPSRAPCPPGPRPDSGTTLTASLRACAAHLRGPPGGQR